MLYIRYTSYVYYMFRCDLNIMHEEERKKNTAGDDSHANQAALLTNMAQDGLDHEAPAAAISVP